MKLFKKLPNNFFVFTGLWTMPLSVGGLLIFFQAWYGHIVFSQIVRSLQIGLIITAIMFVKSLYDLIKYGKREFHIRNLILKPEDKLELQRQKKLYPPIPGKYVSEVAEGFLLGLTPKKKYVKLDPSKAINNLIFGPPGSGKTVLLLSTLINNFSKSQNPPFQVVAVDVKGELSEKCVRKGYEKVKVLNPTVISPVGWDIYYDLNSKSTRQEKEEALRLIARSLIVAEDGGKNVFFTDNARDLLTGLLAYFYEVENLDFCSSISRINTTNIIDLMEEVKDYLSEHRGQGLIAENYLMKFGGKKTNSFQDVDSVMKQTLPVFTKDSVMHSLRDCPDKISPKSIDEGYSIFISIPQQKMEEYSPYFRLLFTQMFAYMMNRAESSKPVLMALDELPTMGKIDNLTQALSTLRSRNVSIWCIIQSMSQLKKYYGEYDANTIKDDCQVKTVLNCDNIDTAKEITDMLGTFYLQKQSVNTGGWFGSAPSSVNESLEKQQICEPTDLTTLKKMDEVVLLLDGEYVRVKKLLYYKDKNLKDKANEILKYNNAVKAKEEKENNRALGFNSQNDSLSRPAGINQEEALLPRVNVGTPVKPKKKVLNAKAEEKPIETKDIPKAVDLATGKPASPSRPITKEELQVLIAKAKEIKARKEAEDKKSLSEIKPTPSVEKKEPAPVSETKAEEAVKPVEKAVEPAPVHESALAVEDPKGQVKPAEPVKNRRRGRITPLSRNEILSMRN